MSAQIGKVGAQLLKEKRVSLFAKWWARTRDLPELWIVYIGVGIAAGASIYNLKKVYLDDKSGAYLDPDIRGDPMKQTEEGRVGKKSANKDAEKDSIWWRLAQVKNGEQGPNIGIGVFENYAASRAGEPDIERPGRDAPRAGSTNVQKTPPLVG